ncbi:hypothetical protein C8R43DRAFT_649902 [Mycena crocata]|nr:hypothetical protein C8R43DRAFT_649902 [Mycena crocata]
MILPCSSALVLLSWWLPGDTVAAPLNSSATASGSAASASSSSSSGNSTNSTASTAGLTQAIANLPALLPPTIQQQLNTTLTNLSPGAVDRWVTASPISSTSLGLDNQIESSADLSQFVDEMFTKDPSTPGNATWVDTYIDFLIEAGDTNITETQETQLFSNYNNSTTAFAKAQVKLVQAYEAANPDNVTYVGINIYNTSRIDPLSLKVIEQWGSQGNGSYSKDDYAKYIQLNKTLTEVKDDFLELNQSLQLAFEGYSYKVSLNNAPVIFNLSMVVGGDPASMNARVVPAWSATIVNNTIIVPSDAKQLPGNFTGNGTSPSSSSAAISQHPSSSTVISQSSNSILTSSTMSHAARSTASTSAKKGRAFNPVKAVAKDKDITDHSPHTPSSSIGVSVPSSTSTVSGGTWANDLASSVQFAMKERPEIAEKYFGQGTSGMGPIGRIWTHICVLTTDDPDTPGLDTVQVLGKVWDVLPALKGM